MKSTHNVNRLWFFFIVLFAGTLGVSAANTIIQNLEGGQIADRQGMYGNSVMTISNGDLKFINLDSDASSVGDYFSGYYFDPAYGAFQTDSSTNDRVRVSNINTSDCGSAYTGYRLEGFSYNQNFGYMDFNYDTENYTYICLPTDPTDETLDAYLGGVSYSPFIGFQSLSGIDFDSSVDVNRDGTNTDDSALGRFVKIEGTVASEKNEEILDNQFEGDVRVLGKLTKSTFRKDIHKKIYPVIANLNPGSIPDPYTITSMHLSGSDWKNVPEGVNMLNNSGLYFKDTEIRIGGVNDLQGQKTIVVEGANIYITGDIRNLDNSGVLGIIALQKDGIGGNIYIDPSVTDIHAIMYADRSLISYDGTDELDGSTQSNRLANQLFIRGAVFSENTIGSSMKRPAECPFYVTFDNCSTSKKSMKYDLNFLRRYILVQPVDSEGNHIGDKIPQYSGIESYMGDTSRVNSEDQNTGYRKYPVIIEYDSQAQSNPPPFFN